MLLVVVVLPCAVRCRGGVARCIFRHEVGNSGDAVFVGDMIFDKGFKLLLGEIDDVGQDALNKAVSLAKAVVSVLAVTLCLLSFQLFQTALLVLDALC